MLGVQCRMVSRSHSRVAARGSACLHRISVVTPISSRNCGAVLVSGPQAGSKRLFTSSRFSGGQQRQNSRGFSDRFSFRGFSTTRDPGLESTSVISDPKEVNGAKGIPSRAQQIRHLKNQTVVHDVLVIGGGATGAGCALDAAVRGLSVACIERGDFASETSSRSTKLIWAGIKYMATASAALLSPKLFTDPVQTIKDFTSEMKMVIECHQERKYMTVKQPHLCDWLPICIPFNTWYVTPAPFGHPLFSFFPVLAPMVLKFYDSLSLFQCPPSYIISKSKIKEIFPQLDNRDLKYCAVFYEAKHNDARTNLAIALSAAEKGAHIANYVEMVDVITDENDEGKVVGVVAVDRLTGESMEIRAKKVIFAAGPFTDTLREMEPRAEKDVKPAVQGGAGSHIILPGKFCPPKMGLLDYNTSDGRFLFYIPWQKHTLIGTTDVKGPAETLPKAPEDQVQWLLNECQTYLDPSVDIKRSDVLSSWRGWRPLANDPHLPPGAPVSRDHIISVNDKTGVIFIAGGKWTTWRLMAEQLIDRVVGPQGPKCTTLEIALFGSEGYGDNLVADLVQKYGLAEDVADHLVKTYGGQAHEVCQTGNLKELTPDFPYIEGEVIYACREYACTIEDVLSRRTRLAFLNEEAAMKAIPKVADIMAKELGWSKSVKAKQIKAATTYIGSYAGHKSTANVSVGVRTKSPVESEARVLL